MPTRMGTMSDSVYGMRVATAQGEFEGAACRFRSRHCLETFSLDPAEFSRPPGQPNHFRVRAAKPAEDCLLLPRFANVPRRYLSVRHPCLHHCHGRNPFLFWAGVRDLAIVSTSVLLSRRVALTAGHQTGCRGMLPADQHPESLLPPGRPRTPRRCHSTHPVCPARALPQHCCTQS